MNCGQICFGEKKWHYSTKVQPLYCTKPQALPILFNESHMILYILYIVEGLVGGKELAPIAYRLPVGAKTKILHTYRLLVAVCVNSYRTSRRIGAII
jgi:hypothetical protein